MSPVFGARLAKSRSPLHWATFIQHRGQGGGSQGGYSRFDTPLVMLRFHGHTNTEGKDILGHQAILSAAVPVHPTSNQPMWGVDRLRGPGPVEAGFMAAMTSITWS